MQTTTSYRVLVVDDDEDILYAISRIIKQCGHTVHTADSLESASDVLNRVNVDIALCDMRLEQGSTGEDFLRHSREQHPLMGVVMMSCNMPRSERLRLESSGAFACLEKPFFKAECQEAIAQFVNGRSLAA